jgi:hypothetical protein
VLQDFGRAHLKCAHSALLCTLEQGPRRFQRPFLYRKVERSAPNYPEPRHSSPRNLHHPSRRGNQIVRTPRRCGPCTFPVPGYFLAVPTIHIGFIDQRRNRKRQANRHDNRHDHRGVLNLARVRLGTLGFSAEVMHAKLMLFFTLGFLVRQTLELER